MNGDKQFEKLVKQYREGEMPLRNFGRWLAKLATAKGREDWDAAVDAWGWAYKDAERQRLKEMHRRSEELRRRSEYRTPEDSERARPEAVPPASDESGNSKKTRGATVPSKPKRTRGANIPRSVKDAVRDFWDAEHDPGQPKEEAYDAFLKSPYYTRKGVAGYVTGPTAFARVVEAVQVERRRKS